MYIYVKCNVEMAGTFKRTNQLDETLKPLHLGDNLNFVGKNKKVHDFLLKLGVTHWGTTFFVIKKFWSAPGGKWKWKLMPLFGE